MEPTIIAIDLAKRVFQIHYVEPATGAIHSNVLKRTQLVPFFANRPASRVVMEACGSDHRWFEERAPACTLLVYVDNARSRLMELHFTQTESTFSYFEATRGCIERHGKRCVLQRQGHSKASTIVR